MAPQQAIGELRNCYQEYIEKYQELQAGLTVQDILAGWIGSGKVKEQQAALYEEYAAKGQECVEILRIALDGCDPSEVSRWVEQGLERILFYNQTDSDLNIMLIAMETLAEPLIPLLSKDATKEILTRYQKRTPKYRMLPNQSKILKLLKKNS